MKTTFFIITALLLATLFASKSNLSGPSTHPAGDSTQLANNEPEPQSPVIQSINGGYTWEDISENLPPETWVSSITPTPFGLVAGTDDDGVYLRNNLTRQWAKIGGSPLFDSEKITCTFYTGHFLYAGIFQGGFFRYDPARKTWKPMHARLPDKNVRVIIHYGNSLMVGTDGGIYQSYDEGKTWIQVFNGGQVTSIVENEGTLWAGTYRGLMKSDDEGRIWRYVLDDGASQKIKKQGDELVYIRMGGFVRATENNGRSWHVISQTLSANTAIFDVVKSGSFWICSQQQGLVRGSASGFFWPLLRPAQNRRFLQLEGSGNLIYAITGGGGC